MIYAGYNLEGYIQEKRVYTIAILFTTIISGCAVQDIAADGWSVSIVKECNYSYSAIAQMTGLKIGKVMTLLIITNIGTMVSSTLFFSFNSLEFCNSYIYSTPQDAPVLDEYSFLRYLGYFVLAVSFYVLICHDEKNDRTKIHEDEEVTSIKQSLIISWKLAINKNMLIFIAFCIIARLFVSLGAFLGNVYLLDELKYSQEKFSYMQLLIFPINMIISTWSARFSTSKPLFMYYCCMLIICLLDLFRFNILFNNYSAITDYSPFLFDCLLFIVILTNEFIFITLLTDRM